MSSEDSEHSDLLEIQALYKSEFTEEAQALKRGGADKLPSGIRKRTTGRYQKDLLETLRSEKKDGTRQTVGGKLLGIAMGRWTPSRVTLQSCEDYSGVKTVDKTGKPVKQKPGVRVVQTITVVKSGASWRIESSNARVVNDFQDEPCNGKWYS